jgi:hypothetical protein
VVVCAPVADRRFFIKRNLQMSSSNLAVRTDDTATDLLSLPPRSSVGVVNATTASSCSASVDRLIPELRHRSHFATMRGSNGALPACAAIQC